MKTPVPLRPLAHADYLTMREGARVMEADRHGDKVLHLPDGTYFKLFRRKRRLSSAAWYPYVRRFADNTRALQRLGIPCPRVIALYRIAEIERDLVHYAPLEGETVRRLVAAGLPEERAAPLRRQLLDFVARLHRLGIYFRSCHLGNIVLTPDGELGLIDLADLQVCRRSLGFFRRRRNYRHIVRDARDRDWLRLDPAWAALCR